ncbi:enoyl-CoA hydratase-related protein [Paenibacillus monticola]|uniref:Enoyl-CoA hydratase n=1 Tax=Paenibacillus monticola TaxID=2666075 RepID=A0A7X2H1J8_9BACL|nr:enoyl-CoA hydratase-related protein [Paenibacillus monticola]MRN51857.1 enoyl-CoA hydratase [Paenibacillus monticola]
MTLNTVLVESMSYGTQITLNRRAARNSINRELLLELNMLLDELEGDPCKIIVLQGQPGYFCTGMDFAEATESSAGADDEITLELSTLYMHTLKRISLYPKVIISVVDGEAIAGGLGMMAASDLVIATSRSRFALSEALWGLLPSMAVPYIMRRTGYQKAYMMSLTTLPVNAEAALSMNLIDEIHDSPSESIHQFSQRLLRLKSETVMNMKAYFRKLWLIDDEMEEMAIERTNSLVSDPRIKEDIRNYLLYKKFPWE